MADFLSRVSYLNAQIPMLQKTSLSVVHSKHQFILVDKMLYSSEYLTMIFCRLDDSGEEFQLFTASTLNDMWNLRLTSVPSNMAQPPGIHNA